MFFNNNDFIYGSNSFPVISEITGDERILINANNNIYSISTIDLKNGLYPSAEITITGDATTTGINELTLTLANTGVVAGTYTKFEVDSKGRVLEGFTLQSTDIPNLSISQIDTLSDTLSYKVNSNTYINIGEGLTGGGSLLSNVSISHASTSTISNTSIDVNTIISSIDFDNFGHVIDIQTSNLPSDILRSSDLLTDVSESNKIVTESDISELGVGDMIKSVYDPENIEEQLVGKTSEQTLTNKTLEAVTITGASTAGQIQFTGGTGTEGTVTWNDVDGTINIALAGATLQAGQEIHFYGKAYGDIANGDLCMFAGVQGDHILIAKADANTIITNHSYLIGVATMSFTNGNFGYVTWFGKVNDVYTNTPQNQDTADWFAGDILYFDNTTGQMTKNVPVAPETRIQVCVVIKAQTGESENGILLVRPTFGLKLEDIENVDGTAPNTTGQVISWNQTDGKWERAAYNIDDLKNKLDGIESGAEVNTVTSVNTKIGSVILDADDIDDTSTTNKFVTSEDLTNLSNLSGTNTGDQDLSNYALKSNVLELDNDTEYTPTTNYEPATKKYVDDSISLSEGYTDDNARNAIGNILIDSSTVDFTFSNTTPSISASVVANSIDQSKLSSEVNSLLLLANSSIQLNDLSDVATSGSYNDLSNTPSIPTALSQLSDDTTHRVVTDTEKTTWNSKQDSLTADVDYLTPSTANSTFELKDSTILKDADIGVTVQAYNANTVIDDSYVHTDNNFTTTEQTKLSGVEALADVTDSVNVISSLSGASITALNDVPAMNDKFLLQDTSSTNSLKYSTRIENSTEVVYALSGSSNVSLTISNGTIQTHTLSDDTSYVDNLSTGQSITLMIDDGTSRAVTWPTITWLTNNDSAPTLKTTGYTTIVLAKIGSILYGWALGV